MEKIAVGPEAAGKVDINASVTYNLLQVAKAKNKDISDVVATLLDRPRHQAIVDEIREAGARIKFIQDGDVGARINTAFDETGIDIMFGTGGAPEGVIARVALKCLGGDFQAKLVPEDEEQLERRTKMGVDVEKVLYLDDLVKGDDAIFANDSSNRLRALKGVQYKGAYALTHSVVMRAKSGTVRFVEGRHALEKNLDINVIFF